jgi:uncharacterized OB-fold protein
MTTQPSRAAPAVTDLTRPFWDAAREGRLAIQRCADCRYYNHPPKDACDNCLSTNLTFEDVSGRGSVWSWTVMHQKSVAGFEDAVPYLTALVELDEQPMLLLVTNLPGVTLGAFKIGDRVHVTFEPLHPLSSQARPEPGRREEAAGGDVSPGLHLPQFVLEAKATPSPRKERGQGRGNP